MLTVDSFVEKSGFENLNSSFELRKLQYPCDTIYF